MQIQLVTKHPTVQIVTANQALIDALLTLDTPNRDKKNSHIAFLRNEIRSGNWKLTNSGVGVSTTGFIIDGGHRLEAIKQEGYPAVQFILTTGLQPEAQTIIDTGAYRSLKDRLKLYLDMNVSTYCGAALASIWRYRNNWVGRKVPVNDAADLMLEFADIHEKFGTVLRKVPSGFGGGLMYYYRLRPLPEVEAFINHVCRGDQLEIGTPAYVLNRLANTMPAGGSAQREAFEKTIACCETHASGKSMARVYGKERWSIGQI